MVYCGRPSTSCNNCRVRKRRCDKKLPECGQCHRTGHECGGYRDPSSFIFHDENSKVIDKARSRGTKKRTHSASEGYGPSEPTQSHNLPEDALLRVSGQSTFSYEANGVFIGNDLPMDFFDDYHAFSTSDSLFTQYPDNFDSILAPSVPSLESSTRDEGASSRDDIGSEDNNNSGGCGNDNSNEDLSNDQNMSSNAVTSQNNNHIARPFSLPLDMIGLNFFLGHYVVRQSGPSTGFLDYTFAILAQEDGNEMLEGAILALGFTGLARTTQQQDLMHRSTMMYARTKQRIDRALAEPHEARKDSTIVTMLILALYEFSNKRSLESWKHHITGATSLLALRGKSQLTTPVGIQIFKDIFLHVLLSCIYVAVPMPPRMRMLRIEAAEAIGASDPYWVATGAAVELLDLYQHIRPTGYSFLSSNPSSSSTSYYSSTAVGRSGTSNMPVQDLERHLYQALEVDQRLERLSSECSPEWKFAVKRNRPPTSSLDQTCVHGDVYHIYHDVWVANVWTLIRICRIMSTHAIGHLVLRAANADGNWFFSNEYADRLQQVSRTMMGIRDDILASVPHQMGYVASPAQEQQQQHHKRPTPLELFGSGIQVTESSSAASSSIIAPSSSCSTALSHSFDQITYTGSAVGAYFASWALVMVGSLHCLEAEARAWTVAQLRRISSRAALDQADDFANCVESSKVRPPLS